MIIMRPLIKCGNQANFHELILLILLKHAKRDLVLPSTIFQNLIRFLLLLILQV